MRTLIVIELGPHVVGNAADKHGRIEFGLAGHTKNLAIVGVEAHHRAVAGIAVARLLGARDGIDKSRLAGLLNGKVDRELDIGARTWGARRQPVR